MTAYTYTVSIPQDVLTPPPGCGNGVTGVCFPAMPVNLTTYTRQLFGNDRIEFNIDPSVVEATMYVVASPSSVSPAIPTPFTTIPIPLSWPLSYSIMPTEGVNFSVTVAEKVPGAWQIWFDFTTKGEVKYYIADPEVQTQTGGTPPEY